VFNQVANQRVEVKGGRNVVIIGGEININIAHGTINNDNKRMGLKFKDQTGTVHAEGLWLHGEYINEGIQIDAPDADVQIYNVRIDQIHGAKQRPPYSHADIVQPWGGVRSLKIDYMTGSSHYQGFLFKADYNGPLGPVDVRHTNIEMLPGPSADSYFPNNGGRYGIAFSRGAYTSINWDSGTVWMKVNPNYKSPWYKNMIDFNGNGEPSSADAGSDGTGNFVDMNSYRSDQSGRIYEYTGSTPPGGDYVPASSVGSSYNP
jgi:hypothetical protein